jgi:hypothetical protein
MADATDHELDEVQEASFPTKETYRKLVDAIDRQELADVENLLGSEEAEATMEIQDKIFELAKIDFNAAKRIFKLFDDYCQISQEFVRR